MQTEKYKLMKRLLKISLLIVAVTLFFVSCSDDDDNDNDFVIEYSTLPTLAKDFISTHFSGQTPTSTIERYVPDENGTFYTSYLTNGYKIDFNRAGQWVELEGYTYELPSSLYPSEIPLGIKSYVETNYPTQRIKEVERFFAGAGSDMAVVRYKVELTNDVDLLFSATGEYLGIDN